MENTLKVILDANIFVNPDSHRFFGRSPKEALTNFMEKAVLHPEITLFIPPSVFDELAMFIENIDDCEKPAVIVKKPPAKYDIPLSSLLLYEFVDEIRARVNKGMRIAEKYARKSAETKDIETVIKSLRAEYREALREGIIDSSEDFDLILLAKEIQGTIATSDTGLIKWAHKFGLRCLSPKDLKKLFGD